MQKPEKVSCGFILVLSADLMCTLTLTVRPPAAYGTISTSCPTSSTYQGRESREKEEVTEGQGGAPRGTWDSQNVTQATPFLCSQHSLIQSPCHCIRSLGKPVSATARIPTQRKGIFLSIPKELSVRWSLPRMR